MLQKKFIPQISLSLASIASGAFASVNDTPLDSNNILSNIDNSEIELDTLVSSSFSKEASVEGTQYARRLNTSVIGSSISSGSGAGSAENCYSNCHAYIDTIAQCVSDGYTSSTACSTNYTKVVCPDNSARWRCDCHTDTAQQCTDAGYGTTTCSTGYTKTNCTYNSSYWKCTCHSDACPTYKTNADNARANLVTAMTGPKSSKTAVTGLSNVSGVFTLSTSPYYSDGTDSTNILGAYNAYKSLASTYNASCSPAYSNTYSCYSNCHAEACDGYLSSQTGISVVKTDADITTAMASSNATVAVLADVSLPDNINLGTKKLVGPKYFTASSLCTSMSTPTITSSAKTIDLGTSGTFKQLNASFNASSYNDILFNGSGTIDTVSISSNGKGTIFNSDGSTMNLNGTINVDGTFTSGYCNYTKLNNSGKIYVNGPLNISGSAAMTFDLDNSSTFEIKSGGNLKYTASGWGQLFEANNSSIIKLGGPVTMPSINTGGNSNYSYGFHKIFYMWKGTKLYLNGSGNTFKAGGYFVYASSGSLDGATTEINGSTSVSMSYTGQKIAFKIDHGNYHNPAGYKAIITAPVTISGLNAYTGSYAISQADHMFYLLDATLDISSTVSNSGTGAYIRNIRGSFEFRNGSYISGVNNVYSDIYVNSGGTPKINIYTGAKIKIGSTCKKATSNKTYVGTSTTAYEATWTSPPSPYTGGC